MSAAAVDGMPPAADWSRPKEPQRGDRVAGHILVDPQQRESYLAQCVGVIEQARKTAACLDFSLTADLLEPGRINIFERWESQTAVEAFRGSGPSEEQVAAVLGASVAEYDTAAVRALS